MYSALTVADEILKIAKVKKKTLTPLQLMKLTYIAHGFSLAVLGKDLFQDRIEAWKFGPVIPDLYQATKHFGRAAIPLEMIEDAANSNVSAEDNEFLKDIFEKYGNLTGFALSSLTHKSGTPWDQVFQEGVFGIEIPDSLIKDHYLGKLNEPASSAA